jgi:Methyltransferase FkbM domain
MTFVHHDLMKQLGIPYYPNEIETLNKVDKYFHNTIFYDVGSYLGLWSLTALLNNAFFVFGFDLYPEEDIVWNLARCGYLRRFRIMNTLVTDNEHLDGPGFRITLDKFKEITKFFTKEGEGTEKVIEEVDSIIIPGFVKIDVEGNEMEVLRGGKQLLVKYRPHVMVESHDYSFPGRKEEILEYMDGLDYAEPEFINYYPGDSAIHHIFFRGDNI